MDVSAAGRISYDVIIHILDWLRDDYRTLYHCSVASRTLRDVTATFLYRNVTYSPSYITVVRVLDLRHRDDFVTGFFASARLPHNAPFVRRLQISGYLSARPPPLNKFPAHLKAAVECWPNLQTVVFSPAQYHETTFTDTLPLLLRLSALRDLAVNGACASDTLAPVLVQLRGLESLTIQSPGRAILQLLPGWLAELRPTLRKLHLTGSCGSVTPGVLRSFVPHLQEMMSFALGLSYSLTDNDVFTFMAELPCLESLEFRYYLQLRPSITPRLPSLRNVTVYYTHVTTRTDAAHLYKWIRRVSTHSSLTSLRLVCESEVYGSAPAFDPLLEHLSARHAATLRKLDAKDCFFGRAALREFCRHCTALEELSVGVSGDTLQEFPQYASDLRQLHSVAFRVRNRKRPVTTSLDFAKSLIYPESRIRRLTVDGKHFEGRWASTVTPMEAGSVRFVVEEVDSQPHLFPWELGVMDQ
ncbi:hypothetical protein L226DRAFT_489951 [Lentinus tigrinus ALCF2SS1-7]|uniref:F-box domain-containing protein n=1 Tax=Lentinus tigrinus ALCF2SS1-6 TaxID=1328759 RepID=A0A5C2SB18_9APHY|nr:hypothetical protein L227DRAFT_528576 [Lentinus tigrinus ALCF2SS1-6]RPD72832.1 hypothetical protein L226DRAFT_489951 [Lentinus tigrinus ALCF2SS1-7]